jgi:uncharacterized membrane protein
VKKAAAVFGPDGPRGARLGGSGIVGLLTFVVALAPLGPAVAAVLGWILGAGVFVAWTLWVLGRLDGPGVQTHATREDSTRVVSDLILIGGSIASLAGVGVLLASQRGQGGTPWEAVLGVLCVVVSWVLVHTVYLLRYAALYYRGTAGGIDFNQAEPPDYHDFAYLAFTLGMTYQVSDTAISRSEFRRAILRHTLLSYVFGSVVLATTINLVVQLASPTG